MYFKCIKKKKSTMCNMEKKQKQKIQILQKEYPSFFFQMVKIFNPNKKNYFSPPKKIYINVIYIYQMKNSVVSKII